MAPHRRGCQARLAWSQLPGHAHGGLHPVGTTAPLRGCSLPPGAGVSWDFVSHLLRHAEARRDRTEEEQEEGITFFGEKVHVSGLAPEGTTLHSPTGMGCWVLSGQAKLPAALLAIGQAPEAMPRKNPVRGQDWEAKIRWERDWQ